MSQPILQFGTSRFLQAHVDLFVSEAMTRGAALGGITVVQTTSSESSQKRIAALAEGGGYPVRVRGMRHGVLVDEMLSGNAVRVAWHAESHWAQVRDAVAEHVEVIVSNTGDRGFRLDDRDTATLVNHPERVPQSFPAKLLVLLHARWERNPDAPLSLFPCELVVNNGDTLRELVVTLAVKWRLPEPFTTYLRTRCIWANSLVDRIVSQAIEPVGAVAEPYALWAIEQQPGLVLPCTHENIVLTDDLQHFERLKLFLLNLGHSYLAERWLEDRRPVDETVCQAMNDPILRASLETVWAEDVLPTFAVLGQREQALAYLVELRERLLNPFLEHRIADIAQNHTEKLQRRFLPLVQLADKLGVKPGPLRIRAMLERVACRLP
ncbi:mannitol dehydrogenase family protein [Paraburkholderia sp. UCT2]|uniref:mannitol dehydrogenase family protein n=1 Tax=Paraburkholderia sp. UCT2 TaxID=2615208 RepID=UPI0016560857|nr:mannitol dehydrogenase family protein [Paraburkholderia sp. UCT2]MBC8728355.1 mannitol dehydrogenase family protein [Paraburkholderia sp. UCT2]